MLFRSTSEKVDRVELMVLIRPTVLATPEIAALHTAEVRDNSPGITKAEREEAEFQRKLMDKERKEREQSERRGRAKSFPVAASRQSAGHLKIKKGGLLTETAF